MSNFRVPSSGCLRTCCKNITAKEIFAMLDGSFFLATSAIHLITIVPACLLGLTEVEVALNSLIHPSIHRWCVYITFV